MNLEDLTTIVRTHSNLNVIRVFNDSLDEVLDC
jgi:hypothetical protein